MGRPSGRRTRTVRRTRPGCRRRIVRPRAGRPDRAVCARGARDRHPSGVPLRAARRSTLDLDLLRACSSTSADLPIRPWVRIGPSGSGYSTSCCRTNLHRRIGGPRPGPDAIQAAVASGNTIAYSALTPDDVDLPARCVATSASAPCIAPDDRERYPLLVPMWFAATSVTLANELVTAMLQPDIVAASASGGVVIEGEPRADSEVSSVPTG